MRDGRRQQTLWDLTAIVTNQNGVPLKTSGKYHYRCLACGTWKGGSTKGIKPMESHVLGTKVGGTKACKMTTPMLIQRLELGLQPPPVPG